MARKTSRPKTTTWIVLGGHVVLGIGSDGVYRWRSDSHPSIGDAHVFALARNRCNEIERAIAEVDGRLRALGAGAVGGGGIDAEEHEIDRLLDRRSAHAAQLRQLREFLASVESRSVQDGDPGR
jgi:hypothetical protein